MSYSKKNKLKTDMNGFGMIIPAIYAIVAIAGAAFLLIGAMSLSSPQGLQNFGVGVVLLGYEGTVTFKSKLLGIGGTSGFVFILIGYLGSNIHM
jgi:hypothetical protein